MHLLGLGAVLALAAAMPPTEHVLTIENRTLRDLSVSAERCSDASTSTLLGEVAFDVPARSTVSKHFPVSPDLAGVRGCVQLVIATQPCNDGLEIPGITRDLSLQVELTRQSQVVVVPATERIVVSDTDFVGEIGAWLPGGGLGSCIEPPAPPPSTDRELEDVSGVWACGGSGSLHLNQLRSTDGSLLRTVEGIFDIQPPEGGLFPDNLVSPINGWAGIRTDNGGKTWDLAVSGVFPAEQLTTRTDMPFVLHASLDVTGHRLVGEFRRGPKLEHSSSLTCDLEGSESSLLPPAEPVLPPLPDDPEQCPPEPPGSAHLETAAFMQPRILWYEYAPLGLSCGYTVRGQRTQWMLREEGNGYQLYTLRNGALVKEWRLERNTEDPAPAEWTEHGEGYRVRPSGRRDPAGGSSWWRGRPPRGTQRR